MDIVWLQLLYHCSRLNYPLVRFDCSLQIWLVYIYIHKSHKSHAYKSHKAHAYKFPWSDVNGDRIKNAVGFFMERSTWSSQFTKYSPDTTWHMIKIHKAYIKLNNDLELFTKYLNPIHPISNEDYLPFSRIFIILHKLLCKFEMKQFCSKESIQTLIQSSFEYVSNLYFDWKTLFQIRNKHRIWLDQGISIVMAKFYQILKTHTIGIMKLTYHIIFYVSA